MHYLRFWGANLQFSLIKMTIEKGWIKRNSIFTISRFVILLSLTFFLIVINLNLISANAWNVSNASYDNINLSTSGFDSILFKPDGTMLYVGFSTIGSAYQYTLSPSWNLTSAIQDTSFISIFYFDIFIKSDSGTKAYIIGSDSGESSSNVYQYNLSVPWNISNASTSYDNVTFNISAAVGTTVSSRGLFFKPDGTKMYAHSVIGNVVYQFSLSQAWNLSTVSYDSVFFTVDGDSGLFFKSDGTKMYNINTAVYNIYQYNLSTPWIISTAATETVSNEFVTHTPNRLYIRSDGTKAYIMSQGGGVFQYSMTPDNSCYCPDYNTNWDINISDGCNIDFYCDLGAGNLTFSGTGTTTLNSTLYCQNFEFPATNQRINIGSDARIFVV